MFRIIKKYDVLLDKKEKKKIIGLIFMMIVGAFLEVLGVGLMVPLISAVTDKTIIQNNKFASYICNLLGITSYRSFVIFCVIILIIIFVIKDFYLILEYNIQYKFIYDNRFKTQKKLLEVYLKRPYEFFLNVDSGEIIRIVTQDVAVSFLLLMSILSIITETVVSIALVITVFIISPIITTATAISMLLTMFIIFMLVKPELKRYGLQRQTSYAALNKWLLQAINGIKEIKISQTEQYFQSNYNKNGKRWVVAERKSQVYSTLPRMLIEMICISSVLIIIVAMILGGTDIMSIIPALSAFAMAALKLLPSANRISNAINQIVFQEPALDNLLTALSDLEEMPVRTIEKQSLDVPFSFQKEVRLNDVCFSYPNTKELILDNADMIIPKGASVGIIGASGAGKTTVVDVILGLLSPISGTVSCDDCNINSNYQEWVSHMGYIPQMIFMLDDTIKANILFGKQDQDEDDQLLWKAIDDAQLGDFVRSLPEGLNTNIGERGIRISGGQRQRIGIARALYDNPEILIFDEATSALDNETEEAIMESINALRRKKTMIIIAHRMTTIKECDIVYRVADGKIFKES